MVRCSVLGCGQESTPGSEGISFHKFPSMDPPRNAWIYFCGRPKEWEPTKNSVICSKHFTPADYERQADLVSLYCLSRGRAILKKASSQFLAPANQNVSEVRLTLGKRPRRQVYSINVSKDRKIICGCQNISGYDAG